MTKTPRPFHAAKATATGARQNNQDRCFFFDDGHTVLLGVADGLGGHPRGEVAAQLLADVSETRFRKASRPLEDPESFMLTCIGQAHLAIQRYGMRQKPPIAPRTTAVLAVIQDGLAQWAHVGDSRLYVFSESQLALRTSDHAQIQYYRSRANEPPRSRTSLTRCLGGLPNPPLTTCSSPVALQAGDALLLCTDGLWHQTSELRLADLLAGPPQTLEARLPALVSEIARQPGSDNVTAVTLAWTQQSTGNRPQTRDDHPQPRDLHPPIDPLSTHED